MRKKWILLWLLNVFASASNFFVVSGTWMDYVNIPIGIACAIMSCLCLYHIIDGSRV